MQRYVNTIYKIILISRPRFWLYLLGPYLLGASAASGLAGFLKPEILYGLFYFLLPANIVIYAVNDYFDRSIDITNPKKKMQETYMKPQDRNFYLTLIVTGFFMSLPLFFISREVSFLLIVFFFFGIFYSCPPLRFKTKPFFDSASNFFYIIPGILSYCILTAKIPPFDIILSASLWSIAMHLFSAIVDITSDRKAGIMTSATVLGYKLSLVVTSIVWLFSMLFVRKYSLFLYVGCIYFLLPLVVLWKKYSIDNIYWLFPWITAIVGFSIFCFLLFYA